MTRSVATTAVILGLASPSAGVAAQFRDARSTDYLFTTMESDARVVWVNPASLGTAFEASLTAEVLIGRRPPDDSRGLTQYAVGFSSRGFGFGFRHDRFDDSTSGNAFRIAYGRGFTRLAVGISVSLYPAESDQREVELGARYVLMRSLEVGAVVRHILKPTVRSVRLPVTGVLGATWTTPLRPVRLALEAAAADRLNASGYDMAYRAAVSVGPARGLPVGLLGVVDFGDDATPDRLVLGLRVGAADHGVLVGDGNRRTGSVTIDGVSLAGVSARPLSGRR